MHVIVAYDVRDDKVRERVRRLLWRYGLSPISKSVYAGRLTWNKAERLAKRLSEVLDSTDLVVIVPVEDSNFNRAINVTRYAVWRRKEEYDVLVFGTDT